MPLIGASKFCVLKLQTNPVSQVNLIKGIKSLKERYLYQQSYHSHVPCASVCEEMNILCVWCKQLIKSDSSVPPRQPQITFKSSPCAHTSRHH